MPNLPITSLRGVGQARAAALARLGITDTASLLRHYPRGYQHRGDIHLIAEPMDGAPHAYRLVVGTQPQNVMLKGRLTLTRFSAFDESGRCTVTFFNQTYKKDAFKVGCEYRFWGRLRHTMQGFELSSPITEPITEKKPLPDFVPVYPLTEGITPNFLTDLITRTLAEKELPIPEILPAELRSRLDLIPIAEALRGIHAPASYDELNHARRRLAFDELYLFALGMTRARDSRKRLSAPSLVPPTGAMERFFSALPFKLTGAQQCAVADILDDLARGDEKGRMARMLSGDVGSGKTAVAAAAVYAAATAGFQSSLMAPTEILATQHYNDLAPLLGSLGITSALLTGSTPTAEKRRIKADLAAGTLDLVIGTHALITPDVEFLRPGLMVCDEQHRFGVMQRASLSERGSHMLVMSATPIPRSLALILCGDLDISRLDELPPGRQKIDSFLVDSRYHERLLNFIRKQAAEGRQTYVVCPAIEAAEEDEGLVGIDFTPDAPIKPRLKSAVDTAAELTEVLAPLKVGCMHGKLRPAEKDTVMNRFASGELDVLVSTTVIEVGVNVPNATLMIIENAERFGLSQLHQLRGRVGRGSDKSYCVLVSDADNPDTRTRLEALCSTNDGFRIAELDLELRGPGDFLPGEHTARQHGGAEFRIAGIVSDAPLLESAFAEASRTLKEDPHLLIPENIAAMQAAGRQSENRADTFN
ncbi:MAG: ATP-dependent DNA helicase RecG [Clostridia bacterium]|nr:ATP-dependent DNA helicase RecG [Clostridia bacterium]